MAKYLSGENIRLALGHIQHARHINIISNRIDAGNTAQTIWGETGNYPFQSVANTLTLSSSSGSDNQTVVLVGLDENYEEITATANLSGTANVSTTESFLRLNDAYLLTGNTNVGDIEITNDTNDDVQGTIESAIGRMHQSVYTVPADHTALITQVTSTCAVDEEVEFLYYGRTLNDDGSYSPFRAEHIAHLKGSVYNRVFAQPLVFPAKADFDVRVRGHKNNVSGEIYTIYDLILFDLRPK